MNASTRGLRRRQRARDGRGDGSCGSSDRGRPGRHGAGKVEAARAVTAIGAYVVHDLRERDGLVRPLLRRAALRLAASRQAAARRAGDAYLRADPFAPHELPAPPPPELPANPGDETDDRRIAGDQGQTTRPAAPLLLPPGDERRV